jgi:hypothetical protein
MNLGIRRYLKAVGQFRNFTPSVPLRVVRWTGYDYLGVQYAEGAIIPFDFGGVYAGMYRSSKGIGIAEFLKMPSEVR